MTAEHIQETGTGQQHDPDMLDDRLSVADDYAEHLRVTARPCAQYHAWRWTLQVR